MAEPIEMPFGLWTQIDPRKHVLHGSPDPRATGQFLCKEHVRACPTILCHELCKNGWIDQDAVWVVDLGGPKEACITWGAQWLNLANAIDQSMFGWLDEAAAMWPYVKLFWLVFIACCRFQAHYTMMLCQMSLWITVVTLIQWYYPVSDLCISFSVFVWYAIEKGWYTQFCSNIFYVVIAVIHYLRNCIRLSSCKKR